MPNELLRTLTIDGVPNDTLGVGNYLNLDANNNVEVQIEWTEAEKTVASLPNGTNTMKDVHTFAKEGWFIGNLTIQYPSNANGSRSLEGYIYLGSSEYALNSRLVVPAASGSGTRLTIPYVRKVTAGSIVRARIWQNSGSALSSIYIRLAGYLIPKVGGVIHRLLNALKPLSFSVERGCA